MAEIQTNAPSEEKKAPEAKGETALAEKKQEAKKMAADVSPSIDATPLSDRQRPKEAPGPGEEDISESRLLRESNQNVLNEAKKNMTSKEAYGDIDEITVDNSQFILVKNSPDGVPYIRVLVYGADRALINQNIPIKKKIEGDKLAYLDPPVPPAEQPYMDGKLA
jgi:hypothetical protein